MDTPDLAAIVEVMADSGGSLPVSLIHQAYRASRSGPIALVLNGVSPQAIDRVLDDVVATAGEVHGLLYCNPQRAMALASRLAAQGLAVASTEPLRNVLASRHARLVPPAEALRLLATLSADRDRPAAPRSSPSPRRAGAERGTQ